MRISSQPIPVIRSPGECGRSSPRGARRSPGAAAISPIRRDAYWSYLRRYPSGPHAWRCAPAPCYSCRLRRSRRRHSPMIDYDLPPPPPDEIVYRRPPGILFRRSGFRLRAATAAAVVLPAAAAAGFRRSWSRRSRRSGCSSCRSRCSCRCRSTSRPPVYVAPPPNNVIFNNIHNTTVINNTINAAPPQHDIAAAAATGQTGRPQLSTPLKTKAAAISSGKAAVPNTLVNTSAKTSTKQVFPVQRGHVHPATTPPPPVTATKLPSDQSSSSEAGYATGIGHRAGSGSSGARRRDRQPDAG